MFSSPMVASGFSSRYRLSPQTRPDMREHPDTPITTGRVQRYEEIATFATFYCNCRNFVLLLLRFLQFYHPYCSLFVKSCPFIDLKEVWQLLFSEEVLDRTVIDDGIADCARICVQP